MAQDRTSPASIPEQAIFVLPPKRTAANHLAEFFRRKPLGAIGAVVAVILVLVAIFADVIANHDPYAIRVGEVFTGPTGGIWLGTDHLGRDVFSRIVHGARISLYVGIMSSFIGCTIGLLIGVASVHFGGKTDLIVQRFIDGMMAFPSLILAIAIMAALGSSLNNVVIALSIVYIPSTARILRSQSLVIKEMDYVLAARAVGAGNWRIIIRHMMPNCFALFIVIVTIHLGGAIIAEASLSFLGVGTPPNVPSWGGMLNGAAQSYVKTAPWVAIFPGLAIVVVVFSWNLLGDALRDVLDPRLRGTG
jgi:peptide/nickel transport system permease protein